MKRIKKLLIQIHGEIPFNGSGAFVRSSVLENTMKSLNCCAAICIIFTRDFPFDEKLLQHRSEALHVGEGSGDVFQGEKLSEKQLHVN
jgi:hypothetical protein